MGNLSEIRSEYHTFTVHGLPAGYLPGIHEGISYALIERIQGDLHAAGVGWVLQKAALENMRNEKIHKGIEEPS